MRQKEEVTYEFLRVKMPGYAAKPQKWLYLQTSTNLFFILDVYKIEKVKICVGIGKNNALNYAE